MQSFGERNYTLIFSVFLALCLGGAFYTGMLLGREYTSAPVTLSCSENTLSSLTIPLHSIAESAKDASTVTASGAAGKYVGSKNGTKYYPPDCPAVQRIKAENMVWFTDAANARIQGYTPASQC